MTYIKAPFNFVPLNKEVFFPGWADQVSHDIPFSDGESGTIELEMTAKTPVFVRNGHTRQEAVEKSENYISFSKDTKGNYFIPATSIKGMIRNVLEIISFGKMGRVSNDRFGYRDLHSNDYKNEIVNSDNKVHCGFLKKKSDNEVEISDHGEPFRIPIDEIDRKVGTKFMDFISNRQNFKASATHNRTARKKYNLIPMSKLRGRFSLNPERKTFSADPREIVSFDHMGKNTGTIVFTGQPSARQRSKNGKMAGKIFEFVFPDHILGTHQLLMEDDKDQRFRDFLFIHQQSADWVDFWKKEFEKGTHVPVFFMIKDNELKHFGLAYMYKIPYNFRVKDCLPDDHRSTDPDFAELIFGNQDAGLKGRVQISHAKCHKNQGTFTIKPLMGSPKASYYPIYLQQKQGVDEEISGDYINYSKDNAWLKGWKRYPVHTRPAQIGQVDERQQNNISAAEMLEAGSTFKFQIRFHNLKRAEIGGLLNAITLMQSDGYHSIGFAKPYGFGTVQLNMIDNTSLKGELDAYYSAFDNEVSRQIPGWQKKSQISELLLMSKSQNIDNELGYMPLTDFVGAKKEKRYLPYFSQYANKVLLQNDDLIIEEKHQYFEPSYYEMEENLSNDPEVEDTEHRKGEIIQNFKDEDIPEGAYIAEIIAKKRVRLMDSGEESQLVIPRGSKMIGDEIGKIIIVTIKQKSKAGKIVQVDLYLD